MRTVANNRKMTTAMLKHIFINLNGTSKQFIVKRETEDYQFLEFLKKEIIPYRVNKGKPKEIKKKGQLGIPISLFISGFDDIEDMMTYELVCEYEVALESSAAELLSAIDTKHEVLHSRPRTPKESKRLDNHFVLMQTYHSTGLEGNNLTIPEIKSVLQNRLGISGKSLVDVIEVADHLQTVKSVMSSAQRLEKYDHNKLCELHKSVLQRSNPSWAGIYRPNILDATDREVTVGSSVSLANSTEVIAKMDSLLDQLNNPPSTHVIEFAAKIHAELLQIHPFRDGNGRFSRLLLNLMLMRAGCGPVIIVRENKDLYIQALQAAQLRSNFEPLTRLIAESINNLQDYYISILHLDGTTEETRIH